MIGSPSSFYFYCCHILIMDTFTAAMQSASDADFNPKPIKGGGRYTENQFSLLVLLVNWLDLI